MSYYDGVIWFEAGISTLKIVKIYLWIVFGVRSYLNIQVNVALLLIQNKI